MKTRKNLLEGLPPLKKIINCNNKLPYAFDLHWDLKTESDLCNNYFLFRENDYFFRLLAENGYDAQDFKNQINERENCD